MVQVPALVILVEILLMVTVSILVLLYLLRSRNIKGPYFRSFIAGAAGWTAAFAIRLIPLQLVQLGTAVLLGANPNNTASLLPYYSLLPVMIWGPIFAGLFEETFRYLTFKYARSTRLDRNLSPIAMGLGWGTGEIIVIYLIGYLNLVLGGKSVPLDLNILVGVLERISAVTLHVALTIMVFYSYYEGKRKIGLYLAIVIHFLFDFVIVIWSVYLADLANTNPFVWTWSLEIVIFIVAVIVITWVFKYWKPNREIACRDEIIRITEMERAMEELIERQLNNYS